MNLSFWKGKRVFLTGHTGFKGSWMSLWLQKLGVEVTGFSQSPPTNPNLFEVANVGRGMSTVIGDIRDEAILTRAMQKAKPEIVIHMAAQPLVRRSYVDPVETFSTNVMGTVNLLEAVRQTNSVRAVVIITTDKCYENKEWVWGYRENEPMGGFDPYSSSKGCAELVTAAYRRSFFNVNNFKDHNVAVATARAGNVIGGGDWAEDRLIPDILRAIQQGQSVRIRNPNATRPWQHVLEPLSGYLNLAEKLLKDGSVFAEPYNFGPAEDDAKSVQWIVEELTSQWSQNASWHLDVGNHPHEAHFLRLDCSKARAALAWSPRWNIGKTLKSIIEWHKAHSSGQDMNAICMQQITDYTSENHD